MQRIGSINSHKSGGNKRRFTFSKTLLFLWLLLVTAHVGAQSSSYPMIVEDGLGREVKIASRPERIVLAGKATLITANAFYLFNDYRDNVVAIGKTNQGLGNFLPYLDENFDDVAKLAHEVGPEQIIAHRPDLVIIKDFMYSRLGEPLEKLGVPVFTLSLETAEAYQDEIIQLGRALNREGRAEEIRRIYSQRLQQVDQRLASLPENRRPSVLLLYYSNRGGDRAFNIAPADWMQTYQVEQAGGRAIWKESNLGKGWKTVNFEQIAAWDPDYICITSFNTPTSDFFEEILSGPQWSMLRATREGRVLEFPADFYSWAQPDVRWILGIEWLAKVLHPELFSDFSMDSIVESFYQEMYNLDGGTYDSVVKPRLEGILE
ncbi:MAG TPA: ABC transporter substrate-binding protein [Sediminispirochaeta sp.]|nr:ABC transporter substrate-binding protein [Sediminispirochaeta sp.]